MGTLLRDLLARNATLYAAETAVQYRGRALAWAPLRDRVHRLANALRAEGVQHGERIAIVQANGPQIVEVAFASALLGAVLLPMSTRLARPEKQYVLGDAGARWVFASAEQRGEVAGPGRRIVTSNDDEYEALLAAGDTGEPPLVETPDDVVVQLYTSGTTGRPKGALLTQDAMAVNGYTTLLSQGVGHGDVFLSATPLTHAAGATRIFSLAVDGLTHVILERFDVAEFLATVAECRVTTTILVPTMLKALLEHPGLERADLSSLHTILYGAAPTPRSLIEEGLRRLGPRFVHAYGLTEGCPALTVLTQAEHRDALANGHSDRLGSIGRPVAGVRVRIVDERGRDAAQGRPGELLVRSAKSMVGYWNRPEETAATLVNGWLRTGDVGYADQDGYLYLVDRAKDVLISGGLNVYPSEIERVLRQHRGVADVAVVGVPDERWGEVPVAFLVAADDALRIDDLRALCERELAGYKVPKAFHAVGDLPRNEIGKVVKSRLRERARTQEE